jgi:hypothetical protein
MPTITLDDCELTTVIAALRLFRITTSDLANLPREQGKEMASIYCPQITTSETGEPLMLLAPAEVDDLIDRLKSV